MVNMHDVEPRKLIDELAKELEKMPEMKAPDWSEFVKTGVSRDRPPVETNWWHVRSASVLRSVYKLGPIGVSKLRTKYGGRKNRGSKPDKTFKGGGNIIRKVLQGLEKSGFIKQTQIGAHKGRVITTKGKAFVDEQACKALGVPVVKKEKGAKK
jgi:small subunit ribosomal protein S19e